MYFARVSYLPYQGSHTPGLTLCILDRKIYSFLPPCNFSNEHFLAFHLNKLLFSGINKFAVSLWETATLVSRFSDIQYAWLFVYVPHIIITYALLFINPCIAFVFTPFNY